MSSEDRTLIGVALGGLGAIGLAMVLAVVRGEIANANVALVLVVPVIAAAAVGGQRASTTTAIVAAMSFDFFHTRPYLSLKITSVNDIETTLLLLGLGFAAGHLAARTLRARQERRQHLEGLLRLGRIADLAAQGDVVEELAVVIAAELTSELGLEDCWYEPAPFIAALPRINPDGSIDQRVYRLRDAHFELPRDGVEIPVIGQPATLGRFVLLPTPGRGVAIEQRLLAVALVGQLAIRLANHAA